MSKKIQKYIYETSMFLIVLIFCCKTVVADPKIANEIYSRMCVFLKLQIFCAAPNNFNLFGQYLGYHSTILPASTSGTVNPPFLGSIPTAIPNSGAFTFPTGLILEILYDLHIKFQ